MKNLRYTMALLGAMLITGFVPNANALPMFEGQTGLDCKACHTQNQPKLGKIGRDFALSGMTLTQKLEDEEGNNSDINASLMFKSRYEKTYDKPGANGDVAVNSETNDGILSVPRTAALYVGGRLTDEVGALVSAAYKDQEDNSVGGKVVYTKRNGDGYLGAAVYSTANFGPFSGMEVYNTGLYRPLRTFDIMKLTNANQASEVGTGKATGLQLYYAQDSFFNDSDFLFASIGVFSPSQDNSDMNLASNFLPMARIAYEYPIGDFNFIFGGFAIGGGERVSATDSLSVERETYGIDLQIEGKIAQKNVTIIATKVLRNDVNYTGDGAGSTSDLEDTLSRAFSLETHLSVTDDFTAKLAYLEYNDLFTYPDVGGGSHSTNNHLDVRDIERAITLGFDYSFKYYLPMKVAVEHSWAVPALERVGNYRDFVVTLNILF